MPSPTIGMSDYKLTAEIISLSESKSWDEAVTEWSLKEIYESDPQTCLCGHFPIIEICVIKNRNNAKEVIIGNCCVKKFMALPSDRIFQAVKRVRKDGSKSLNIEAVEHAFGHNWITGWERNFYMNVMRKKKLTEKQLNIKKKINQKLISNIRNH
jgi:hypothetical protein